MAFSEFTNKIKYSNRISSHLQRERIRGFTECLMRYYLISHFYNGTRIKNEHFSYLRFEDKCYTGYFISNISKYWTLNAWQESRGKFFNGKQCRVMLVNQGLGKHYLITLALFIKLLRLTSVKANIKHIDLKLSNKANKNIWS